ncbi:PREDICTED: uncharacterized protein LOC103325601 [Prunus mume]|uniref:Uncharacterized protein LOC103325601 n=1 Tax=Prunus mume TaxID=102107 RepID=A0ABM0NK83_PRUMU|nr:PREDICTED: uncharacterized protein LOC103325601 [Prunus mume]
MKVAEMRLISALHVCRKHAHWVPPTPRMAPPTPAVPNLPPSSPTFGNPCLDLFYRLINPWTPAKQQANLNYLNQLLPSAWSHNPLTTLKIICSLLFDPRGGRDINDTEGFQTAASWLHLNHPKTLAFNLPVIAGEFMHLDDVLEIPYRILEGQPPPDSDAFFTEAIEETEDKMAMAKKALDRYERDPHYRFLHDRVSELFADCLKFDIENLKQIQLKLKSRELNLTQSDDDDEEDDHYYCLDLTGAAMDCPFVDSMFDCTTLLCESIAKKIFPRISYQGVEEDEADHADRARQLLMKEVLLPLRVPLEEESGYECRRTNHGAPCPVRVYLEEVKTGGNSMIEADALLPHEIIEYVYDFDELRQVAELQWKAMVEDIYLKQGKFRNCLAICDVSESMKRVPLHVSVALGLLVSELNQEPAWKGKVITFNRNPQLLAIQGDDLRSKCAFVRRMDSQEWHCKVDFRKVFDLILQAAVNGNLRPEQMITKVFVFTIYFDFDEISANRWESDYEAIQIKFKEKGYGNVVPHLVVWNLSRENVWNLSEYKSTPAVPCTQPGVTMLGPFINNNLVNSFLENDGDISLDHVMEAAFSTQLYQTLVVVD